jgi:beta-lactamase regulating signal transducer with metallopeptidase domain
MNSIIDFNNFVSIVEILSKGAAVMGAAFLLVACLRKSSAATRHLIWLSAMSVLVLLPVIAWKAPRWNVLPSWMAIPRAESSAMAPPLENRHEASRATERTPMPPSDFAPERKHDHVEREVPSSSATAAVARDSREHPKRERGTTFAKPLLLVWMLVTGFLLARLIVSQWLLLRLRNRSRQVTGGPLFETLSRSAKSLGITRNVSLLCSKERAMPMTWGLFRPKLLLPTDACDWTEDRRSAVMIHELAHIKRWDCQGQLIGQIACAFHWINPLVWLAFRKMRNQCERACDDLVLRNGMKASTYAEHLLDVARELTLPRLAGASAVAMANRPAIEGRVCDVLSKNRNRRSLTRKLLVLATMVALPAAMIFGVARAKAEPEDENQEEWVTLTLDVNDHEEVPEPKPPLAIKISGKWPGDQPWEAVFHQGKKSSMRIAEVPRSLADAEIAVKGRENTVLSASYPGVEGIRRTNRIPLAKVAEANHKIHIWAFEGSRVTVSITDEEGNPVTAANLSAEFRGSQATQALEMVRLDSGDYQSARVRENEAITLIVSAEGYHDVIDDLPSMEKAEHRRVSVMLVAGNKPRPISSTEAYANEEGPEVKESEKIHPGFRLDPALEKRLHWGEPAKNGLQAAVVFEPSKDTYRIGDELKRWIHIRNSGNKPVTFTMQDGIQDLHGQYNDQHGFDIEESVIMLSGEISYKHVKLEPGQAVSSETPELRIGQHERADALFVRPGQRCRIQYEVSIPGFNSWDGKGYLLVPARGEWAGRLTTGVIRLNVADQKGFLPDRIIPAWGRVNEGVQARIWAKKIGWEADETPTFTAEIRNIDDGEFFVARTQQTCAIGIEGDGWYQCRHIDAKSSRLGKGTHYQDIEFTLDDKWKSRDDGRPLTLNSGKHKLRVAFLPYKQGGKPEDLWVFSNQLEFVTEKK